MSRNVFESNSTIELAQLEGKQHTILPPLPEGAYYKIETLSDGRVAIVVEEG